MMPKQLPIVENDLGCQKDAKYYAQFIIKNDFRCKSVNDLPEWVEKAIKNAYLRGMQSGLSAGYRLCEKDMDAVLQKYKCEIEELKRNN